MSALREELQRLGGELPAHFEDGAYRNVYDLVAREGRDFAPSAIPASLRRHRGRKEKDCYYRAFTVALKRSDLLYVEGFALDETGFLFQHAWLTDGAGAAIDLAKTPPAGIESYIGVPLVTASVCRATTDMIGEYLSAPALLRDGFGPATLERP
jgi:hypothetical protein